MPADLFPAWALSQQQALETAGISRAHTMAVGRFVHAVLTAELPDGWRTLPDHPAAPRIAVAYATG